MIENSRFQTFDETSTPAETPARLAALRKLLRERGLGGFIVPRTDAYQNEYVPAAEERLAWLTAFTGSAGTAVVLEDRAALFVDGRYTAQARAQADPVAFEIVDSTATTPTAWLKQTLAGDARLGYDPWLHTPGSVGGLEAACAAAGAQLVALVENPIDALWTDRPAEPSAPVVLHPASLAGASAADKIAEVRTHLARQDADALLVCDPHSVAWLLNIRGGDVAHTPLPLARALVPADGRPTLFIAAGKLSPAVRTALETHVVVAEPDGIVTALRALGEARARVLVDPAQAPSALAARLTEAGAEIVAAGDPVMLLKAVKNDAEIAGARNAHRRDAAAICRFLAWFDRRAADGGLTEIDAAVALETFRHETGALKDISFPTIAAAGPNAALPHYRVTRVSNRPIEPGFFLIDSGGQYEDGTTDITRTIAVGDGLTTEMKDRFTRVLKGHIAIATARFPDGATGAQLDPFARRFLWDIGADFDHGTGHGVGSYLSVHEGPQRIAKTGAVALRPGMILSNEPGYYSEGCFGIRIENLVLVEKAAIDGGERNMLSFETLTLAPIDRRAILLDLLTREEWDWINRYHARVMAEVGPDLDADARAWLESACAPL